MADAKKNVVSLPVRKAATAARASEKKWGRPVMDVKGFCIIPSLLLHAQARLKMTPTQLAIVIHLADYWWDADRKPWPSKATLGARVCLGPRQLQRQMGLLHKMGLVTRIERTAPGRGKISNEYDLSGLVARLKEIEPEVRAVKEEAEAKMKATARPGWRTRLAAVAEAKKA